MFQLSLIKSSHFWTVWQLSSSILHLLINIWRKYKEVKIDSTNNIWCSQSLPLQGSLPHWQVKLSGRSNINAYILMHWLATCWFKGQRHHCQKEKQGVGNTFEIYTLTIQIVHSPEAIYNFITMAKAAALLSG
jgi:hypothetical protein